MHRAAVIPIKKAMLLADVAKDMFSPVFESYLDIEQLVQEASISRSELRCIEDYDDEVQQCLDTRLAKLIGVDYRLDGATSTFAYKQTAAVLKSVYTSLVTGSFRASLYGYSVQELIYEQDGSFFWPTKCVEKPFEWFNIDRLGQLYYKSPSSHELMGALVDTNTKFLLTRNKATYTRPRGVAMLAVLWWVAFFRFAGWKFWMQFLERSGQPLLVGYGNDPARISEDLKRALMDAVVGMPLEGKVDSISPTNKGEAFDLVEQALVRRIQKVILGQTLTSDTGAGGTGSKALGDVHDKVRNDKTNYDVALVQPTVQAFVNAIYSVNFPGQTPPLVTYGVEKGLESARSVRDSTLINTGTVKLTKDYYMREYGFRETDIEVIDKPEPSNTAPLPSDNNKGKDTPKNNPPTKEQD